MNNEEDKKVSRPCCLQNRTKDIKKMYDWLKKLSITVYAVVFNPVVVDGSSSTKINIDEISNVTGSWILGCCSLIVRKR